LKPKFKKKEEKKKNRNRKKIKSFFSGVWANSVWHGLSYPVLEGKSNANHVRARIRNSRTQ
jgi:hypothetical protein